MSGYVLTLKWSKCPDGAEIVHRGKESVIRYQSDLRAQYSRRLEAPDRLIVTEFLNTEASYPRDKARWPEELGRIVEFVNAHGLPHEADDSAGELSLEDLLRRRGELLDMWDGYEHGPMQSAVTEFQEAANRVFQPALRTVSGLRPNMEIQNGRPVLTLPLNTLYGFMLMETALVMSGGAQVARCEQCGAIFVTGPGTGRRNTAKFCSNRCRVAAQRKAAEEASQKGT